MIDENALKDANDRQTEKAFSITRELYEIGFPSAVSGGCARRYQGWCKWMNDADMLTVAPHDVTMQIFEKHGLRILANHEHSVAGYDADGIYEICCLHEHAKDNTVFGKHRMNWRFEHRALCLDAITRNPIEQPGGVLNIKEVRARIDPEIIFHGDAYMCYLALSYACREDLPLDERLMNIMRKRTRLNFFPGLFFKLISKVLIGRAPSKGMDRFQEANLFHSLPNIKEAWKKASDDLRLAIDTCSDWIQPWVLLMQEHPNIKKDLLTIYFPEQWITYYENRKMMIFPLLDDTVKQQESWTYWQIRKMMKDLVDPPIYIRESPTITGRITPWPFP
jgi:hypothetical protein